MWWIHRRCAHLQSHRLHSSRGSTRQHEPRCEGDVAGRHLQPESLQGGPSFASVLLNLRRNIQVKSLLRTEGVVQGAWRKYAQTERPRVPIREQPRYPNTQNMDSMVKKETLASRSPR